MLQSVSVVEPDFGALAVDRADDLGLVGDAFKACAAGQGDGFHRRGRRGGLQLVHAGCFDRADDIDHADRADRHGIARKDGNGAHTRSRRIGPEIQRVGPFGTAGRIGPDQCDGAAGQLLQTLRLRQHAEHRRRAKSGVVPGFLDLARHRDDLRRTLQHRDVHVRVVDHAICFQATRDGGFGLLRREPAHGEGLQQWHADRAVRVDAGFVVVFFDFKDRDRDLISRQERECGTRSCQQRCDGVGAGRQPRPGCQLMHRRGAKILAAQRWWKTGRCSEQPCCQNQSRPPVLTLHRPLPRPRHGCRSRSFHRAPCIRSTPRNFSACH